MKHSALLTALIGLPLVVSASAYTLVITRTDGTKTEIPTEEVSKIEFRDDTPPQVDPTQLEAPYNIVLTKLGPDSFIVAWSKVDNAAKYGWQIDGGETGFVKGTQVTINNVTAGDHTVSVRAYPADGSAFTVSDPKEKTFTADLNIKTTLLSAEKTALTVSVSANTTGSVTFGIVPASVTGATAQVNYVNTNAAAQKEVFDVTPDNARSKSFTGLNADTGYNVVVFLTDDTAKMSVTPVRTATDLKPGDKATVYPPGVTAAGGWVDVDKVTDLSPYGWDGQDNLMCWACAISGMVQWWLDDYKAKTGQDYPLKYPIPTKSKCYSTPIMDLYLDYYRHEAGDMFKTIKWFFTPRTSNYGNEHGEKMLNEALPYWKGGFAGMTEDEAQSLMVVNAKSSDGYTVPLYEFNVGYEGCTTTAELAKVFSEKMVNALRQGPVAVSIVSGAGSVHGVSCWGADYEVLSDGSLKVNKLHISENDPHSGNIRKGLNEATITYETSGKDVLVKIEMATTGGKKNLNLFFGLRGFQGSR